VCLWQQQQRQLKKKETWVGRMSRASFWVASEIAMRTYRPDWISLAYVSRAFYAAVQEAFWKRLGREERRDLCWIWGVGKDPEQDLRKCAEEAVRFGHIYSLQHMGCGDHAMDWERQDNLLPPSVLAELEN
jgi:hypothetical protein